MKHVTDVFCLTLNKQCTKCYLERNIPRLTMYRYSTTTQETVTPYLFSEDWESQCCPDDELFTDSHQFAAVEEVTYMTVLNICWNDFLLTNTYCLRENLLLWNKKES